MQSSSNSSVTDRHTRAGGFLEPDQAADVVYRGLTIVAMLLLLGSLWVF